MAVFTSPVMLDAFSTGDVMHGRSVVTTLTVFTGIALIPLMFLGRTDRVGRLGRGGDRRPTLLALAMLVLYGVLVSIPAVRDFFDLEALPPETIGLLAAYTVLFSVVIFGLTGLAGRITPRFGRPRGAPESPDAQASADIPGVPGDLAGTRRGATSAGAVTAASGFAARGERGRG